MNTVRRIVKNTIALFATTILQKAFSLILVMYITRIMGVEQFGIYSFIISFVLLFNILTDLGTTTLFFRNSSRSKSKEEISKLVGDLSIIKIILSLGVIIISLSVSFSLYLTSPEKYTLFTVFLIFLLVPSSILESFASLFRTAFLAIQKMEYEFGINTLCKTILFVFSVSALYLGFGLTGLFIAAILSNLINFLTSFLLFIKHFSFPKPEINFTKYINLIVKAFPFALLVFFLVVYANIDIVMLSILKGNTETGYYSAAVRIVNTLAFLSATFLSSIFPVMSNFYGSSKESLKTIIERSLLYLFLLIFPIAIGTTFFGLRIIQLIYPTTPTNNFEPSTIALQILVWFQVFSYLNHTLLNALSSTEFEKQIAKVVAVYVTLNIILNLILIPSNGFIGAAIATLSSEIFLFIIALNLTNKKITAINLKIFLKPVIGGVALSIFYYFFGFLNLLDLVLISPIIYLLILIILKVFNEQDKRIFSKLINK